MRSRFPIVFADKRPQPEVGPDSTSPTTSWLRFALACVAASIFGAPVFGAAPVIAANGDELKAAAFYNIITFTNWPSSAFPAIDAPLIVGIVGRGPIASNIERVVGGESWRGRKIVIEHFATSRDIKSCHVLFIARSEQGNWTSIRLACASRPVLAVSDGDNFAADGGNVQLAIEQNRLHILVNLAATRANGLQLSSNLLHLSTIVGPTPGPIDAPHSGWHGTPLEGLTLCLAQL